MEVAAGVMVPNSPLVSLLGPAEKYSVSELEPPPPPSVKSHRPSMLSVLPWVSLSSSMKCPSLSTH